MQPGFPPTHFLPIVVGYFFVFLVIGVAFAVGNFLLAKRLDGNRVLWAILSIIPLVNYVFAIYIAYRIVFVILDRLPRPAASPNA